MTVKKPVVSIAVGLKHQISKTYSEELVCFSLHLFNSHRPPTMKRQDEYEDDVPFDEEEEDEDFEEEEDEDEEEEAVCMGSRGTHGA